MKSYSPRALRAFGLCCALVTASALLESTVLIVQSQETVSVSYDQKRFVGRPLFQSSNQTILLARDGRVRRLPGSNRASVETISNEFVSYNHAELDKRLRKEFGPTFEVTFTQHYVVVHPQGQKQLWASRFEDLFVNFKHYFTVRGLSPNEPEFRLIALVFHNRGEFMAYSQRMKEPIDGRMVGYYSSRTNRIALYDSSNGGENLKRWKEDAATIYHEAAHQAAFNCGIHHRFTGPPRWVSEGLGTLFEAPGVWNGTTYIGRDARINRRMLETFQREFIETGDALDLEALISNDKIFQSDPQRGYALAWALSFYLSETQPDNYLKLLQQTSSKQSFQRVESLERRHDWDAVMTTPMASLERHMKDYFQKLD